MRNLFRNTSGPAGRPLTEEERNGRGEQRISPAPQPTQPDTTFYTPDEALKRFAMQIPGSAMAQGYMLAASDDPRFYTFNTFDGGVFQIPAYEQSTSPQIPEDPMGRLAEVPGRVADAVQALPEQVWDTVSAPTNPNATLGDALNVAGSVGTGALALRPVSGVPDDALGMFVGVNSRSYRENQNSLQDRYLDAEAMFNSGNYSPEAIWAATGVGRTPAGEYFHEVTDENYRGPALRPRESLGSYLASLPGLSVTDEYPTSRFFPFDMRNTDEVSGQYDPSKHSLEANAPNIRQRDPIFLHEGQHAVQDLEGWRALGMNEKAVREMRAQLEEAFQADPYLEDLTKAVRNLHSLDQIPENNRSPQMVRLRERTESDIISLLLQEPRFVDILPDVQTLVQAGFTSPRMTDYDLYRSEYGELQASATEQRARWTEDQRAATYPADLSKPSWDWQTVSEALNRVRNYNTP